jgi:Holliday junction resolvase
MSKYRKGANAERELINKLFKKGFAVGRIAGSGTSPLPSPDIIAMKGGRAIAIECKAWDQTYLSIAREQMNELETWGKVSGSDIFVAWKLPRKGWFFLSPQQFNENKKYYVISQKTAMKEGISLEIVTGEQSMLSLKD